MSCTIRKIKLVKDHYHLTSKLCIYIYCRLQIKQQMSQLSDWNEKVNFAVKSSVQEEPNRKEISNALNNLRKYLSSTFAYTVDDGLFHGKCIVYHTKDSAQDDIITQVCVLLFLEGYCGTHRH